MQEIQNVNPPPRHAMESRDLLSLAFLGIRPITDHCCMGLLTPDCKEYAASALRVFIVIG